MARLPQVLDRCRRVRPIAPARARCVESLALCGACALVAGILGGAFVATLGATRTNAEAPPYRWWVRDDEPGARVLVVLPTEREAWSDYAEASDARLDDWLARPSAAPTLAGSFVAVTFRRPVSPALYAEILRPIGDEVAQYTAVGADDAGSRVIETGTDVPEPGDFGVARYDPAAGYNFRLEGILATELWLPADRPVAPSDLDAVRRHPAVSFLDTTVIQVMAFDMPATGVADAPSVSTVLVDAPWRLSGE